MRVVALVPAAGAGRRMGAGKPKAFLPLNGQPLIVHTLRKFEECPSVDEILPLVPEGEVLDCTDWVHRSGFQKIPRVLAGGPERQDSVFIGLQAISGTCDFVLIHDGARPFVTTSLIEEILVAAKRYSAVAAALPVGDTLKEVSEDRRILRTVDRRRFWLMQTPQCFRYDLIFKAHRNAREEKFIGTDDAALVERIGVQVTVITGSPLNIKITTPEDLLVAEALLKHLEQ